MLENAKADVKCEHSLTFFPVLTNVSDYSASQSGATHLEEKSGYSVKHVVKLSVMCVMWIRLNMWIRMKPRCIMRGEG